MVDAVSRLNSNGIKLLATQVSRAANKSKERHGWRFRATEPDGDAEPPAGPANTMPTAVSSFFAPTSELPSCGCCGEKLLGDIVMCPGCSKQVHARCRQGTKCFRCVCRVCDSPPGDVMRPCKACKNGVHHECTVQVPFRIEVVCKVCSPKPQTSSPPMKKKKKFQRRFNPRWQIGRPWLQFANGVMWCIACREFPQPGMHPSGQTATTQLRGATVVERGNSGVHAVAVALWQSGGASTTVIGGLSLPVRAAIFG